MKKISISNIPNLLKSLPKINKALKTRWISSAGKYVREFEELFSKKIGNKYSVTMSNGTTALISAINSLKSKNTKYVAVPSLTFGACANAIKSNNCIPVFIDSDKDHWNISVNDLKKKYNIYKFKILIVVHLNGYSANMTDIMRFCKKNKIKVIEDCAEALFTKFRNKYVGNFGHISTFSFFANKLITTGEGGMCSTKTKSVYNKIKISASHGMDPKKKYWHITDGFNHRMTSLQAIIGITMLSQVTNFIQAREFNNSFYLNYFKNKNYFKYIKPYKGDKPVMWYFPFILSDKYVNKKFKLMKYLEKNNIEVRSFFYPLDTMKIFSKKQTCFNSNNFSKRGIYLPVDPTLNLSQLKYICKCINSFFS